MKIKQVSCENVKGIPNGVYQLADVLTVISGPNGSGKTTFIDIIQYILAGGKAPENFVKAGEKKAAFAITTEHNGMDTEIKITKTSTEDSQMAFKLNGKAASMKKIQEYIAACDGSGKIIRYSDVLENLKPKELADMMLSYIPISSKKETILGYMSSAYQSKNPEMDSMTTFTVNEVLEAKTLLAANLPDMVSRQDIIGAAEKYSQNKSTLLKTIKSTMYSIQQIQAMGIDGTSLRTAEAITANINELQALKLNAESIKLSWDKYQKDVEAVKAYNVNIQDAYNKIQNFVATEPDEKEMERLSGMITQWSDYQKQIATQIATATSSLKLMQDGLNNLDRQECPLSKQLRCTTDKTPVKNELTQNVAALTQQIAQMQANSQQAETNLTTLNEQLKQFHETKALFTQKQTMIANYNQMLSVKPIDPIAPIQQPVNVDEINQQIMNLQKEYQLSQYVAQLKELTAQVQTLIKQYHIANYLLKELDPKGSIMEGLMNSYVGRLNSLISEKVANFSSDWSIDFIFDNGLIPTAKIGNREAMPYPELSSGEKSIVALFITDMLNSLDRKEIVDTNTGAVSYTGLKTLLIDGLEKLDVRNFANFLNAVNQPAIHDAYDNIIINVVNHAELTNQVLTGNMLTFSK